MGFSWSLYYAQAINTRKANSSSQELSENEPIIDRGRKVTLAGIRHYVYVDNIGVIGWNEDDVNSALDSSISTLENCGLKTHEKSSARPVDEMLGMQVDGIRLRCRCAPTRFWKLYKTLEWALSRRCLDGRTLECIVGHCTYVALLNRPSSSIFCNVYKYIRSKYNEPCRIWKSVRDELFCFRAVMVLLESQWTIPWSSSMVCTDACPSGYGTVAATTDLSMVSGVGQVKERTRFKSTVLTKARERVLSRVGQRGPAHPSELPLEHKVEIDATFPEVPPDVLFSSVWEILKHGPFKLHGKIHVLEGRAVYSGALEMVNRRLWRNCRALLLTDNMATVLAMCRSRARDFGLLRQVRRVCALCLHHNIWLCVRWIASETNPADGPSRVYEKDNNKVQDFVYSNLDELDILSSTLRPLEERVFLFNLE